MLQLDVQVVFLFSKVKGRAVYDVNISPEQVIVNPNPGTPTVCQTQFFCMQAWHKHLHYCRAQPGLNC